MSVLQQFTVEDLVCGVGNGDRTILARAITLIESTNEVHQIKAQALLQALLPYAGTAYRIGITGVPGVGKSTTIDQLGINLIETGHRVAVLAVDPTSQRSGGSILGDKTRMNLLASHPNGFVRPSPTSGTLGGVTKTTRETMALLEAAGYDVIIVETVGVGQSEVAVAQMVDFFLVLLLPGGGDELQGLKKGIIELADMIAINKADGERVDHAERAAADYQSALRLLTPVSPNWQPPVVTISGLYNIGLEQLWESIKAHHYKMDAAGELAKRRANQNVQWMHDMLNKRLLARIYNNKILAAKINTVELKVRNGMLTPSLAIDQILDIFENA